MGFSRNAALAAIAVGLWLGTSSALAGPNPESTRATAPAIASEVSAQTRRLRRAPTRIYVYPRPYSYPGPNAKRDCVSWLEPEYRPSGTVIVPRLRCRWIPG